jgi:hypothetical protein
MTLRVRAVSDEERTALGQMARSRALGAARGAGKKAAPDSSPGPLQEAVGCSRWTCLERDGR